ncbi:MAG: LysR family transcriptional regulator [Nitrospira sp.]|nr:LysR family transcriptional regulator [Nitrospira sp.]
MEMRQLRYFLAVAKQENFTRAAEIIHVSQPSLSVQIAALEEEVGLPLFDRMGRRVALTEAGEILREHAVRVLDDLEQGVQAIQELKGAERGRLIVGALSTVNSYLIPPLVCRFRGRFPNVHLQVHAQPSSDIVADLLAHRRDLGLCLLPPNEDRLATVHLFDETLVLVAPADFRPAVSRMRMEELAKFPLVLMPVDYCLRKMVEAECARAGVKPQVSVEMTAPEGILEAVRHGAGLSILPEFYVRQRLRGQALRVIRLHDPVPKHPVVLAYLAGRHLGRAAQEFIRLCRTTFLELDKEASPTGRPRVRAVS